MAGPAASPALRAELDRIDDAMHDLLMQRAEVVEQVAQVRQARRLPAGARGVDHPPPAGAAISGALPPQALVRIWRELLAGTTAMQGQFSRRGLRARRRRRFTQTGARAFRRADPAARATAARRRRWPRSAAARPRSRCCRSRRRPKRARRLVDRAAATGRAALHVVARLPFWAPRPDGAPAAQALVVAATRAGRQRSATARCSAWSCDLRRQPRPADGGADRGRAGAGAR